MCASRRPTPREFFANWRDSDAPYLQRLRIALRNNWIKVRTGSSCCGNDGEPGC